MRPDSDPQKREKSRYDRRRERKARPLDEARLEEMALAYVARFATSAGKLRTYLRRKLRERGWIEDTPEPDLDALVARYVEKGYVDDEGFARAKSAGLLSRGYGARRVEQQLHAAGIGEGLRARFAPGELAGREAVVALARKRRFGPFTRGELRGDETWTKTREKQLAAMIRAGHAFDHARRVIDATDPALLDEWVDEAREEEFPT
jgi:regulatory protein